MPFPPAENAVEVRDLVKHFGPVRAVDGVSFTLPVGRTLGLLGGNGAGKTTTIGMLMGLIEPTGGTIRILGEPMPEARGRLLERMNFESPYVDMPHRLTVRQNLTVFGRLYRVENTVARIERLAADFDLTELLDRRAGKLSAGQKTRVALAKALLNSPAHPLTTSAAKKAASGSPRLHTLNPNRGIATSVTGTMPIASRIRLITISDTTNSDGLSGLIRRLPRLRDHISSRKAKANPCCDRRSTSHNSSAPMNTPAALAK